MSVSQTDRKAVALSYHPEETAAPVIVAMGSGAVADRMLETAKEHQVPVVPDADLTKILSQLSVGDEIPPELYAIVAKIMAYISELDESFAERMRI